MTESSLPAPPAHSDISPEFRLTVACSWIAPPALERLQAERIALLGSETVDWQRVLELVRRHGVAGMASTMLRRHAAPHLPEQIATELKADHIQSAGLALRQGGELCRIGNLFAAHSIEALVMKGLLLSRRLYGDPTLRSTGDIDLMIRQDDFDLAERIVRDAGYRCVSPGEGLTERQKQFHREVGQNCEYRHDSAGHYLELHWRSYLWSEEQTSLMWDRCQVVDWMGEKFRVWDDDSLILFLCYHGAHHEWSHLKWLSDVAMLLSEERPGGWGGLIVLAEQLGMKRILAQTVLLLDWLYEIPLPDELQALANRERGAERLARKALGTLLQNAQQRVSAGKRLDGLRHAWYLSQLGVSFAAIAKGMLIKYSDFREFQLPNALFWLYVPLRPFFWLWRNYIKPLIPGR